MLQPVRRRTWAPRGQTPIQHSWDRHDRLSTISAITVSPIQKRFGIYFRIHRHNVRFTEVMQFIRLVRRHLGRKFILVLDRFNPHRKAVRLLLEKNPGWFEAEWLPAYAPELNPVEQVWNHSKYSDLANFIPDDVDDLQTSLAGSISAQGSDKKLIRSYFHYAGLKI